eukprot:2637338-Pyramimonas_sp.AAC.1
MRLKSFGALWGHGHLCESAKHVRLPEGMGRFVPLGGSPEGLLGRLWGLLGCLGGLLGRFEAVLRCSG